MDIAVLIKQVPDTWSERTLKESDWTLDRDAADAVIDEIDTTGRGNGPAADREARRRGHRGDDGAGPGDRRAAQGAGDGGRQGSAHQRRRAGRLRRAADLRRAGRGHPHAGGRSGDHRQRIHRRPDRVGALDARRAARAARRSPRSGPWRSTARTLRAERVRDGGYSEVTATLPAVISVTEKINEPRYPGFKGIMAAKKKPVTPSASAISGSMRPRPAWPTPPPWWSMVLPARRRDRRARRSPTTAPAAPRWPSSWPPRG